VRGEQSISTWRFDRLFLFAILLYAVLTAAFAWHFLTTYVQPPAVRGGDSEPVQAT
jgi:hypothetical protein